MAQAETPTLCTNLSPISPTYRTTSGGFNNPTTRVMEYRQAFLASLRKYERPNSAYSKLGGMSGGLRRTASTNTFQTLSKAKEEIKKRDWLTES